MAQRYEKKQYNSPILIKIGCFPQKLRISQLNRGKYLSFQVHLLVIKMLKEVFLISS